MLTEPVDTSSFALVNLPCLLTKHLQRVTVTLGSWL